MADFVRVKNENLKTKQSEIAKEKGYSTSTLQRYRNDTNVISPYRIKPNNANKRTKKVSNTNFNNNSQPNLDVKRPQKTSNDLKTTSNEPVIKKRNKLKGGSFHNNVENNEHYLDEILQNNNS